MAYCKANTQLMARCLYVESGKVLFDNYSKFYRDGKIQNRR